MTRFAVTISSNRVQKRQLQTIQMNLLDEEEQEHRKIDNILRTFARQGKQKKVDRLV